MNPQISKHSVCCYSVFYQTGRYEVGLQLAEAIIKQKPNNSCFINNRFLFRLLDSGSVDHDLEKDSKGRVLNPFARFNFEIATELPSSWDKEERPLLKSKLLFQDFRFGITHKNKKKGRSVPKVWRSELHLASNVPNFSGAHGV